jgi:asparagine N-glycosylation enzyme membrane subunit Stt3
MHAREGEMKKENVLSILLKMAAIGAGGIFVLAATYMGYFAIFMFVETVFFSDNIGNTPAEAIRISYSVFLLLMYFALLRTDAPELLKAILIVAPLTMLMVAAILGLYLKPLLSVLAASAIVVLFILLMRRSRKPWIYYFAIAISVLFSMAYAWPRE